MGKLKTTMCYRKCLKNIRKILKTAIKLYKLKGGSRGKGSKEVCGREGKKRFIKYLICQQGLNVITKNRTF